MKWMVLLSLAALGCSERTKVIDPFPIDVDRSTGPILLAASENDDAPTEIVVDVLSPITILDSFRPGQELPTPKRQLSDLTLLGLKSGTVGVPRVRFSNTNTYDLHPCNIPEATPSPCLVGQDGNTREIFGVLGADILRQTSVRFDFPSSQIRFFPDAAGSAGERTLACDAVFNNPFGGGGTLQLAGNDSEIRYGSTRPTLGVCTHFATIAEPDVDTVEVGVDLQMAISTGIGISLLSEEAYTRYANAGADEGVIALADLPTTTVFTASGPIEARLGELNFIALTGNAGEDSAGRGPCREVYANARMRTPNSCADRQVDCPCPSDERSCKAAAIIEINRTVAIAVVPSSIALLQGLRDELRPQVPELDGILGVGALAELQVEFDFPNDRILARCQNLTTCTTRPQVRSQSFLDALDDCRAQEAEQRTAGIPDAGAIP